MIFLVLCFMNKLILAKGNIRRCVAAAALGGLAAALYLIIPVHKSSLFQIASSLLVNSSIIRIAYGKQRIRKFILMLFVFYVSTFLFSGGLQFLQTQLQTGISLCWLLFFAILLLGGCSACFSWLKRVRREKEESVYVELLFHGKTVQGTGFLDTGNCLHDPISGEPVVIANKEFLEPVWCGSEEPVRMIPYHSIGKNRGIIKAFRCDCLRWTTKSGELVSFPQLWVAISEENVSKKNGYDLILHSEMTRF